MRMRTHKSKYFTVSNTTAQDQTMSFAALGLLTYCLSKPGDWEFCPKQIWKERDCGRDKIYQLFNELIEKFHCIRIKKPNPKMPHLPGEIEYEFYDDIEDCKIRIEELEKVEKFIEHGYNLKKCLRSPEIQEVGEVLEINELWDPENTDPQKPYITKERVKQTKENNKQEPVVVPSFIQKIEDLTDEEKKSLAKYPEDRVKLALEFNKKVKPTHSKIQQLIWHCKSTIPPKTSKTNEKNNLYEYCIYFFKSNISKSCEVKIQEDCIFFIPMAGADTTPIEIRFNQENCTESIKKLCNHYCFIKK